MSNFWDPGYVMQSGGIGYQPLPEIKTRLGAALRETFAKEFSALYTDDAATTETEKLKIEGGLESVTEAEWQVMENVLLKSKLELFAPFKTFNEVVLRSDNTLAAKVNKYISINFNVQFINEKKITPRTQIKEALAAGISYTLL